MPNEDEQVASFWDLLGRYKKATITLLTVLVVWGFGVASSPESWPTALEWLGLASGVIGTGGVAVATNKQ